MTDIKQKYQSKFFFKRFIFRSEILEKLKIFPKWSLWMRHQTFTNPVIKLLGIQLNVNKRTGGPKEETKEWRRKNEKKIGFELKSKTLLLKIFDLSQSWILRVGGCETWLRDCLVQSYKLESKWQLNRVPLNNINPKQNNKHNWVSASELFTTPMPLAHSAQLQRTKAPYVWT
jgi:hypothetical protein